MHIQWFYYFYRLCYFLYHFSSMLTPSNVILQPVTKSKFYTFYMKNLFSRHEEFFHTFTYS